MMPRRSVWMVLGLWVLAAGLMAQQSVEPPKKGEKLPALTLQHEGGDSFQLAEQMKKKEAKGAILAVWSIHCPVCDQAMGDLEKLHQLSKKNKILFYGLNVDAEAGREQLDQHRKDRKVSFSNALDPRKELARQLGVQSTPTVYLVGEDQTLLATYQGFTSDIAQAMQRDLSEYVVTGKVTGPAPQASFG